MYRILNNIISKSRSDFKYLWDYEESIDKLSYRCKYLSSYDNKTFVYVIISIEEIRDMKIDEIVR